MTIESEQTSRATSLFADIADSVGLLGSSIRGGVAKIASQMLNLAVKLGFIAILSRMIDPHDFGLFAMAMVFVGLCDIIANSGLGQGAVQSASVSPRQISTLFIFYMGFAVAVGILCLVSAGWIAGFYDEPRIRPIILALIPALLLNAAGSIPSALLQRRMRFVELAVLETVSALVGSSLGIVMAILGYGYWALVGAALASPLAFSIGAWLLSGWLPGRPGPLRDILSMLRFGATVMANSLVVYGAYNGDKVLLGRFWGPTALGIYSRANQPGMMTTTILQQATAPIAFSALSRLQNRSVDLRRYFLNYYRLVNAMTVPASLFFCFFAPDVIDTLLGGGWEEAHGVFRRLAPTILILGMMNPAGPLILATGHARRSLAIGIVLIPVCFAAYLIGLPGGPEGVATAYTIALSLWLVPHLVWSFHGTPVRLADALHAIVPTLIAGLAAAALAFALMQVLPASDYPIVRLALAATTMGLVYFSMLYALLRRSGDLAELVAVARGIA